MDRVRRMDRKPLDPRHAHLIGIAEPGMTGVGQWLVGRGYAVSGTLAPTAPLARRLPTLGIHVHTAHFPATAGWTVYAESTERVHPARLAALRAGVPQASWSQFLNALLARNWGIAFWGDRAGSMAAAMAGWVLVRAGLDPTVLLHSASPQLGGWGRMGRGPCCVVLADPLLGSIDASALRIAVLLNLDEFEPPAKLAAFGELLAALPRHAYVLASGQSDAILHASRRGVASVELVSLGRGSAWWGADLREERGRYRFRAFHRGRFVIEAKLQVPGRRNVLSALAAVAVCRRMDVSAVEIKEGLEEFKGIEGEMQSRGSWRGVTLVDDEASDPRHVAEAVHVCRQAFGQRRLGIVVGAPEAAAPGSFALSLRAADWVLVATKSARAAQARGAGQLLEALALAGVRARSAAGLEGALADLEQHLEPGDVLLTLGAGPLGTIADALTTRRVARNPLRG
jgi:UDP-N-acetylmuramate--alanine ligase